MPHLPYYHSTVDWPATHRLAVVDMVFNAREISRRTFLQHVNRYDLCDLEAQLGYASHPAQGMTMASDQGVTYHKARLRGGPAYYFRHSSIEYVFYTPNWRQLWRVVLSSTDVALVAASSYKHAWKLAAIAHGTDSVLSVGPASDADVQWAKAQKQRVPPGYINPDPTI